MKILENCIIAGLIALLGFGIYLSTQNFLKSIEKETPPAVEHQHEEKKETAETPSPQEPEKEEVKKEETTKPHLESLGVYKITAYCACKKCCGKTDGITASGTKVKAGRTIAAPKNFPFGTKLMINGHVYTVEDRGGAIKGKRIDIYFDTHEEALKFGVKNLEVFKVNE